MPGETAERGSTVLVLGSGGREHALVWKLAQSPRVGRLLASPGSDAIAEHATCVPLEGHEQVADFAEREGVDLTVVGPEQPLVAGLADALAARGLRCFGPTAAAARLEGSKAFAKAFMERHGIPTAAHRVFDDPEAALAYVDSAEPPLVVKADGLAAGKGVAVCRDRASAREAIRADMEQGAFGAAGARVVIESCLEGEEASYFAVCDGERFVGFPSCQDHKPVYDGDRGPNTGGMGAYCPAPVVDAPVERRIVEQVVEPTLRGMAAEGHPYTGVLYVGLMIRDGQPWVVEYNCRFGDPECQPLMMMLESDLMEILDAATAPDAGALGRIAPRWRQGAAACIVMASGGYPGAYGKGHPIRGLDAVAASDTLQVFHAGTRRSAEGWVNAGGRVLGVTAWGPTLRRALDGAYAAAGRITWQDRHYRTDIGHKGLER